MTSQSFPTFFQLGERPVVSRVAIESQDSMGISPCGLIVGIAVLALVVWFLTTSNDCGARKVVPVVVSSMKSTAMNVIKKGKDIKNTIDNGSEDAHVKVDKTLLKKSKVVNLTKCSVGDDKCSDMKNVDPKVRSANDDSVVKFIKDNPTSMIMIYANWCPHCHNAMPKFVEASANSKVPFALVNAELVSPKLIQGDESLFNVTHFPYILRRELNGNEITDSTFKGAPTVDEIKKHAELSALDQYFA